MFGMDTYFVIALMKNIQPFRNLADPMLIGPYVCWLRFSLEPHLSVAELGRLPQPFPASALPKNRLRQQSLPQRRYPRPPQIRISGAMFLNPVIVHGAISFDLRQPIACGIPARRYLPRPMALQRRIATRLLPPGVMRFAPAFAVVLAWTPFAVEQDERT